MNMETETVADSSALFLLLHCTCLKRKKLHMTKEGKGENILQTCLVMARTNGGKLNPNLFEGKDRQQQYNPGTHTKQINTGIEIIHLA